MARHQGREFRSADLMIVSVLSAAILAIGAHGKALALSELKPVEAPSAESPDETEKPPLDGPLVGPDGGLPAPDPVIRKTLPATDQGAGADAPDIAVPAASVDVITDLTQLPEPVLRMRTLIIEAAATGDPERLRALLGAGPTATRLSFGDIDTDPVDYIRSISGDGEGLEILAILIDLLNANLVRVDAGDTGEIYLWPSFAALPLEGLTAPQRVELLRIVTAGDVEDMKAFGGYNFFRVGISPEGDWRFFMAGD